jgi:hypothetical protein
MELKTMAVPGGSNVQPKHASFVSRTITAAQQFKAAYDALAGLAAEYNALGYSSALTNSDMTGNLVYLSAADVVSFYTAQGNLVTYWNSGNGTDITALIP